MKKSKIITSAVLSVAMCTGLVFAISANAADTASEPSALNPAALSAPIEEFKEKYPEQYAQELAYKEAKEATTLGKIEKIMMEELLPQTTVEEISAKLEEELGITTYSATEPRPIDELEQDMARAIGFPSRPVEMPYAISTGEIPKGYYSYSAFYFRPTSNTINLTYNINGYGAPKGKNYVMETVLYRQRKSWEGSSTWERVEANEVEFGSNWATTLKFYGLDSNNFVYCLGFHNTSPDSGSIISGMVTVSE